MDPGRLALLTLHLIPGVGSFTVKQLISYCGNAEEVFRTPLHRLRKIPGIGPVIIESLGNARAFHSAENELLRAEKMGVEILFHTDPHFPTRLKHIPDAPSLIYYKGDCGHLNDKKVIALVGTRKATSYGLNITDELIQKLLPYQPLIISGLAFGIDAMAHRCSLKYGLPTMAVMAGGINHIYPAQHRSLANEISNSGGLLTENGLDNIPDPPKFPARNRIIAGMADVVIVVEAAARGGALITAEIANDYNRDVLAIPGRIDQPMSTGCNNLIKKHKANLLTDVADIEYLMNWVKDESIKNTVLPELEDDEQQLYNTLRKNGNKMHIDHLSWSTQFSINKVAAVLLQLEFKGVIRSTAGKQFEIIPIYQ